MPELKRYIDCTKCIHREVCDYYRVMISSARYCDRKINSTLLDCKYFKVSEKCDPNELLKFIEMFVNDLMTKIYGDKK